MAAKTKKISTLIESQLPGFISDTYELFSKFIGKYYEQLESPGQPLDIIHNITKYKDINFYDESKFIQSTVLNGSLSDSATTITVDDAQSFPEENGYIKIGDEICFYKERTNTQFLEVSRGVSGNNTLGDLYTKSEFVSTQSASHSDNSVVYNISNLFLYAFVRNFENEYLSSFPDKSLKEAVDKRTLISNIGNFYKAKGTDRSIVFLFNTIISKDPLREDVSVYNPKDFTFKASVSDWASDYKINVVLVNGDPDTLEGSVITQQNPFATASIEKVISLGNNEYQLVVDSGSVVGNFVAPAKTTLINQLSALSVSGDKIDVVSTASFPKKGILNIGNAVITYSDKTVNQFTIQSTQTLNLNYNVGFDVYSGSKATTDQATLYVLDVIYNVVPNIKNPYCEVGDLLNLTDNPISTTPFLKDTNGTLRWFVNNTNQRVSSIYPNIDNLVNDIVSDVSALYEDEQYYYVASSSYPAYSELVTLEYEGNLVDKKLLKVLRKNPINTTEIYETNPGPVGILVDGSPLYGYKDEEYVSFGNIEKINITNKGTNYAAAPFVLINEQPGKARSSLLGERLDSIEILEKEIYSGDPTIRITSGEGAVLSPVITEGRITSIEIVNPGQYYSSPPEIVIEDILGKGSFAEYRAVLNSKGEIAQLVNVNPGRLYTRGKVRIEVRPVGKGAFATANVKRWTKNRLTNTEAFDNNNGYAFNDGYGVVGNPKLLRRRLLDSITAGYLETPTISHSPIIGYAFDGNPIYGPYGYSDPLNSTSSIARMVSGYELGTGSSGRPSQTVYPLGTLIEDYNFVATEQTGKTRLDANNGRFCVTPDYPEGVYAYFVTIDAVNNSVFPYMLGENYYSLPVASNYENFGQDDLPSNVKRIDPQDINGTYPRYRIKDVSSGGINSATVAQSPANFKVNAQLVVDNTSTNGEGAKAKVTSIEGKDVTSIESKQTLALKVETVQSTYYFDGDIVTQQDEEGDIVFGGEVVGDVLGSNIVILRDLEGTFNQNRTLTGTTEVIRLIVDIQASFTRGATLSLVNEDGDSVASGEILESTSLQNSVTVKVLSGTFEILEDYFLKSSNLADTSRAEINFINSLSSNISIFNVNEDIAIVETSNNHELNIGDLVDMSIIPDELSTETTYYVRNRKIQQVTLKNLNHNSKLVDTGVGSVDVLNSGNSYDFGVDGVYEDVELIFVDQSLARPGVGSPGDLGNAKATMTIYDPVGLGVGPIGDIEFTDKGSGYRTGDVLTVNSIPVFNNTGQTLVLVVDHVGFAKANAKLYLTNVNNISTGDYLKIDSEIVKVGFVDTTEKSVTVTRGEKNTVVANHYDNAQVTLEEGFYNFSDGYRPLGENAAAPYFSSFDQETNILTVVFDYGIQNPTIIQNSTAFVDQSIPQKLVQISSAEEAITSLEFSKDDETNFVVNPIIELQKYYSYKFDTSHPSMADTVFDFSSSLNYNIFTPEKVVSLNAPGTAGSFVSVRFGFGPNIVGITQEVQDVIFQNYYYFVLGPNVISSGEGYFKIIDDPLSGTKVVDFATSNKFVYLLDSVPQYDGTGDISYTTNSSSPTGKINSVGIVATGSSYTKLPIVKGVPVADPAIYNLSVDTSSGAITGVEKISGGSNYVNPVAVLSSTGTTSADLDIITENGSIKSIVVRSGGLGYDTDTTISIVESDVNIYFGSNDIGLVRTVSVENSGSSFNKDNTLLKDYTSNVTLLIKDFEDYSFRNGMVVSQGNASGIVTDWRAGTNILKLRNVSGKFYTNQQLSSGIATVVADLTTTFDLDLKSYSDNLGRFFGEKGVLDSPSQRITDSFFYQDYSYVIRSKTSINDWRDLVKDTTHPAGFVMFSEMVIDAGAKVDSLKSESVSRSVVSTINLPKINVYSSSKVTKTTLSILNSEVIDARRGKGTIAVDQYDFDETQIFEVELIQDFTGNFDSNTGQKIGLDTFNLKNKETGNIISVAGENNLVLTLDGILQEPGESFICPGGSTIIFSEPPFGTRIVEGQEVGAQKFFAKYFTFRNSAYNNRYFRKINDISGQFDGEKTEFDLFWSDGSIVKSEPFENFLVTIDSVLQRYKDNENSQFGNSYYIVRSESELVTDKIVFTEPPKFVESPYEEAQTEEFINRSSCFIYGIGNYDRLTIKRGAFGISHQIIDEVNSVVTDISEPLYALVFVDGVLQNSKSYTISGSTIRFTEPLRKYSDESGIDIYQRVDILVPYGRNRDARLTGYDFEPYGYTNQYTITIDGVGVDTEFSTNLSSVDPANYTIVYQGSMVLGRVIASRTSTDQVVLVVESRRNEDYDDTAPLEFYNKKFNITYTLAGTYTVNFSYDTDADGVRVLGKTIVAPWLYKTENNVKAWNTKNKLRASILPGDKIKIDGEKNYRTVKSIPEKVYTRDYRSLSFSSHQHYGKIIATKYSGRRYGFGLTVDAVVENGSVVDLIWNKRDFENNTPGTTRDYFTTPHLYFIPQTNSGGGAAAKVVINPVTGHVIDIELVSGGSGYEEAPEVIVAREYEIIKERKFQKEDTIVLPYTIQNRIQNIIASANIFAESEGDAATAIFTVFEVPIQLVLEADTTIIIEPRIEAGVTLVDPYVTSVFTFITEQKVVTPQEVTFEVLRVLESTNTSGQIELKITENITNIVTLDIKGDLTPVFLGTSSDLGAFLDAPLTETTNIIYAGSTRLFPDTGKLLIGKELVFYNGNDLVNNRFLQAERGYENTIATTHNAGDYFRLIPEFVSVISVPLTITSISQVSSASAQKLAESAVTLFLESRVGEELDIKPNRSEVVKTIPFNITVDSVQDVENQIVNNIWPEKADVIQPAEPNEVFVQKFIDFSIPPVSMEEELEIQITSRLDLEYETQIKQLKKEILIQPDQSKASVLLSNETITRFTILIENFKEQVASQNKFNLSPAEGQEVIKIIDLEPLNTSISDKLIQEASLFIEGLLPTVSFGEFFSEINYFIEQTRTVESVLPEKYIDITNTLRKIITLDLDLVKEIVLTGPNHEYSLNASASGEVFNQLVSIIDQQRAVIDAANRLPVESRYIDITNIIRKIIPLEINITKQITQIITPDRTSRLGGINSAGSFSKITEIITTLKENLDKIITSLTELNLGPDGIQTVEIEREMSAGAVDSIETDVVLTSFVLLNDNVTYVDLLEPTEILRRDSSITIAQNESQMRPWDYLKETDSAELYRIGEVTDKVINIRYSPINVGFNLRTIENNAFLDTGVFDIDGNGGSISGLISYYTSVTPTLTIEDFERNSLSKYTIGGETIRFGVPSIQEFGALLDGPLTNTDTTINIRYSLDIADLTADNNPIKHFPNSGKLLVGNEVVSYTGKTFTTFTGVTRGIDGTTAQSHLDGDYLRSTR
jgi:hypothetical protein